MEEKIKWMQGGIYLAKLDPAKNREVGKIRPVVLLTTQVILDVRPPILFVCPLSSQSYPEFKAMHVELPPRDHLQKTSYALVEHCRSISELRLDINRLAQLSQSEFLAILSRLQRLVEMS